MRVAPAELRPCRSGSLSVFVDGSPETAVSADVQAGGAARLGDWMRDWTKWCGLIHRLVRAVPVVVVLDLPQRA